MSSLSPATIHILHVDDDPDFADMVATFLERENERFTVETAVSTAAGLERFGDQVDCIVSDYDMPGKNGIEFLEMVRDECPDTPFILYTGKGSEEVASDAISAGVTDYLQKESGTDQYTILANRITNAVAQTRAVQEVTRTRAYFRTILEHASDYVMVVDENAQINYISPAVEHVFDYTPEDLEGSDALEHIHPEDRVAASKAFTHVLEHPDQEHTVEYRVRHADGSWRWVEVRGRNRLDDSVIKGIIVSVRDITQRKARQQKLRQKERRYQAVFNDPNILVGMLDTDGTVLDINETAMGYIDPDVEDLTGEPFWETPWFAGDETVQQEVREWIDQAAAGEYVEFELDLSASVDEQLVVSGVFRPVTNDDGEVVSLLISDRDITEQKVHERLLEQYEKIVETMDDVAFVVNDEWTVEFANEAILEYVDAPLAALEGHPVMRLAEEYIVEADDPARFEQALERTFEQGRTSGSPERLELTLDTEGEQATFEYQLSPLVDDGETSAVVITMRDITERKQQEERFQAFIQHSTDIISVLDPDGTYHYRSPSSERITGYESEELLGDGAFEYIHPDDRDDVMDTFSEAVANPEMTPTAEYRFKHADGSWRWFESIGNNQLANPAIDGFVVNSRDITERKQRTEEIETLKERLELAIEGANLGVWDWDMTTDEVEFNTQWAEMLGHTLDDIEPHLDAWERRVHPNDLESVKKAIEAHCNGETEYYDTEHRLRTANGDWRWIRDLGRIVERDDENQPARAVGIHLDIDERKTRQRELERTHDLLEQTEHIADVAGWEIDPDTQEVFWTDHLFELLGREPGEEPPLDEALDVYHEEDRPAVEAAVETAIASGNAFDVDARFHRADDEEVRWFRIQGEPTMEEGEVVALRGAVQDITEQRARERQIKQSREDYQMLFNGMHDSAWVVGFDETFRAVNDAAVEQCGYTRDELLSMGPHDIDVGLGTDELSTLKQSMPADEVQVIESVHETKDGTQIPVEISSTLITYRDERAILSVARDISERKQREERLEEFASIVSHDLRNPLSVAQGSLELVREECESDHLERINSAHGRMDRLIQHLLTLASEGSEIGDRESINLGSFVERCWQTVATGEVSLRSEIDMTIEGDPSRLQQFFENLMRNAVEHGGNDVTVTVGRLDDGFYIEDTGPGIPVDHRDAVFNYGYSTTEGGTGFGLSIVKQIADAHGWEIRIAEGSEGGARFEITGIESAAD